MGQPPSMLVSLEKNSAPVHWFHDSRFKCCIFEKLNVFFECLEKYCTGTHLVSSWDPGNDIEIVSNVGYCWWLSHMDQLDVTKKFTHVFRYLTLSQIPMKTSIWHTLSQKSSLQSPCTILTLPLFFSRWPELVQPTPKQIIGVRII